MIRVAKLWAGLAFVGSTLAACSSSHNADSLPIGGTGGAPATSAATAGSSAATAGRASGAAGSVSKSNTGTAVAGRAAPGTATPGMMTIPETPTPSTPCVSANDCGGNAPQCGGAQRCQGCQTNNDCAGFGGLVCDAASGSCVECMADPDCQNGRICSAATHSCERGCATDTDCSRRNPGFCAQGSCVECRTDADCQGEKCDPTGNCVTCLAANDCMPGTTCVGGDCVQTGCTNDAQCGNRNGEGGVCAMSIGACVECLTNAQCGDQGYCQPDHTCGGGG